MASHRPGECPLVRRLSRFAVMSDGSIQMLNMSWHPWRALRTFPDVTLHWARRPGLLGTWSSTTRTITLHPDQSHAERRCKLTHELVHAERNDTGSCDIKTELQVHRLAARRLITRAALIDALAWSGDEYELAEELWVDVDTIRVRLAGLTAAEQDDIYRRLWPRNEGAA